MTESQRKNFYFPKWLAIARGFEWVMAGGRLVADPVAQFDAAAKFSTVARDLVRDIIGRAIRLAMADQRAVTADDLRHALNLVASRGRTDSATKLTNAELNEFDRICGVLARPFDDNLKAVIPYLNAPEDNRRRALAHLRKLANEGRLVAIARNAWGTGDLDSLSQAQLDSLLAEVKCKAWPKHPRATAKVGQPF